MSTPKPPDDPPLLSATPTITATTPTPTAAAIGSGGDVAIKARPKRRVGERVLADLGAAGGATLAIAPVICLIDRSIMENASGRSKSVIASVVESIKQIAGAPHKFLASKPFALVFMTYFGTYYMANTIDTLSSLRNSTPSTITTAGTEKFLATSTTNMGLSLIKDRSFARTFGTGSARPFPITSLLLFSARDAMTVFFSFNVPPLVAPYMVPPSQFLGGFVSQRNQAQILAPAVCQVFSTPAHLLGLDLYNRSSSVEVGGWRGRWEVVKGNWPQSAVARMCRIVPAFGIGGVANAGARRGLLEWMGVE